MRIGLRAAAAAMGAAAFATVLSATTAAAEEEDDGRFAISVAPDRGGELEDAEPVVYTVTVANRSGRDYSDAVVVQMLPAGYEHRSAEPEAEVSGSQVRWTAAIDAGEEVSLSHNVAVGSLGRARSGQQIAVEFSSSPPAERGQNQYSTTVCVRPDPESDLAGCTSAWESLAEAEAAQSADAAANWKLAAGLGAALLLVVAFVAKVGWRRRRRGAA